MSPTERIAASLELGRSRSFILVLYEPGSPREAALQHLLSRLEEAGFPALEVRLVHCTDLLETIATAKTTANERGKSLLVIYGLEDLDEKERAAFLRRSNMHRDSLGEQGIAVAVLTTPAVLEWMGKNTPDLVRWADGPVTLALESSEISIADLYARLSPDRPAENSEWVDLDDTRPSPVLSRLANRLMWDPGKVSHGLAGPRGVGKTEALRRLRDVLMASGGAEGILVSPTIHRAESGSAMVEALLAAATELAQRLDLIVERVPSVIRLLDQMGRFESEAEIPWGSGVRKRTLANLRLSGARRLPTGESVELLTDVVHELRHGLEAKLGKPVVLLVDNLDRVHRIEEPGALASALAPAVMVWPLVTLATVGSGFGVHYLAPVRVMHSDGTDDARGIATCRELLVRRLRGSWGEVIYEADMRDLARASGGCPGSLFRLAREALLAARQLPVPKHAIHEAVDAERRGLLRILTRADVEALRRVGITRQIEPGDAELRLWASGLILLYENGDPWFAPHPLIRAWLERDHTS